MSAVLRPTSVPRRAVTLAIEHDELVMSQGTLNELQRVLKNPKFDVYVSEQERLQFLDALRTEASFWEVLPEHHVQSAGACRDANDAPFLALALTAQARVIVSGDADLLALHPWRGIAIRTAADYVAGHA